METEYVEFTVGAESPANLTKSLEGDVFVQGCDKGNLYSFIANTLYQNTSVAHVGNYGELKEEFFEREKILNQLYDRKKMLHWISPHKICSEDNSRTYRIVIGVPFQIIDNGKS
jgi:hypothetical protein